MGWLTEGRGVEGAADVGGGQPGGGRFRRELMGCARNEEAGLRGEIRMREGSRKEEQIHQLFDRCTGVLFMARGKARRAWSEAWGITKLMTGGGILWPAGL